VQLISLKKVLPKIQKEEFDAIGNVSKPPNNEKDEL
jgi:hypothetical protein